MTDEKPTGAAPKGNQFWKARSSHGAKPKFATPEDLWEACTEYFEWVDANPLQASKIASNAGVPEEVVFHKLRAMTVGSLCIFLDVGVSTWHDWKSDRKDLSEVIARVEGIIYQQKFVGASADLFNANIIARDLGLADNTKSEVIDKTPVESVTNKALARAVASLLSKGLITTPEEPDAEE